MVTITGDDILGAIGLPPADATDQVWADRCADGANAYVNKTPAGAVDPAEDDTLLGTIMLGANMYRRRPAGTILADQQPEAAAAVDNTVARLLRLGYYQKGVVG